MSEQGNILIVDPDGLTRQRLREALNATNYLGSYTYSGSLESAKHEMLSPDQTFSVIFLSDKLDRSETAKFISWGKNSHPGGDCAYVLALTEEQSKSTIASALVEGADGFLLAPYSVEALQGVLDLASRVKKERQATRLKIALRLLVIEIRDQLGRLAGTMKAGYQSGITQSIFREMCSVLPLLEADALSVYFDLLLEIFPNTSCNRKGVDAFFNHYSGSSPRVRSMVSHRALERVKQVLAA